MAEPAARWSHRVVRHLITRQDALHQAAVLLHDRDCPEECDAATIDRDYGDLARQVLREVVLADQDDLGSRRGPRSR